MKSYHKVNKNNGLTPHLSWEVGLCVCVCFFIKLLSWPPRNPLSIWKQFWWEESHLWKNTAVGMRMRLPEYMVLSVSSSTPAEHYLLSVCLSQEGDSGQQGLLPFPKGVRTKYPHLVSQLFVFSQLLISAYSVSQSFRQKRSSAWGQAHTHRCTHMHAPQQSPE